MKRFRVALLLLFLTLLSLLSGCTTNSSNNDEIHDSRLLGSWRNERTFEILEFKADGTYTITEAEMANWSTEQVGKLWMFGTLYSYTITENNTLLSISEQGYTRTFKKL